MEIHDVFKNANDAEQGEAAAWREIEKKAAEGRRQCETKEQAIARFITNDPAGIELHKAFRSARGRTVGQIKRDAARKAELQRINKGGNGTWADAFDNCVKLVALRDGLRYDQAVTKAAKEFATIAEEYQREQRR